MATIITDDLPSGFQVAGPWSPSTEAIQSYVVANGFSVDRTGYGQQLAGAVIWLPDLEARERYARSLAEGTWPVDFFGIDAKQLIELADLPPLGDAMAGLTGGAGQDGLEAMFRYDLVMWRRGDVGALIASAYLKDDEDRLPIGDVARRLDERIAWVLSTNPTSQSHLSPTAAPRLMLPVPLARTPVAWSRELTPTLTLADMPAGFGIATKEMGFSGPVVAADSPYPVVSAFAFQRSILSLVWGFVVNLPSTEKQARFNADLLHPNTLFEEVSGGELTVAPSSEPVSADVAHLGDAARQITVTEQTFFGTMANDLVCLRRGSFGGCVGVESMYPKQRPHARDLAGLLDERIRMYATTRP